MGLNAALNAYAAKRRWNRPAYRKRPRRQTDSRPTASAASLGRAGEERRALALGQPDLGQLIAWGSTFLVIRMLAPGDYGLVAMTGVVLAFLDLFKGWGFASALVRDETDRPASHRPGLRACCCC